MDVGVEAAGGEDLAFARDHFGARADDNGDAGLDIGIASLADGENLAVLDADVGFDDAPMVDNQRVGDDGIDRALLIGDLALAHAVADHLAAAELHLLAIDGEILLDFDDQVGVGEPNAVSRRRTEHVGIDGAVDFCGHGQSFALILRKPGCRPALRSKVKVYVQPALLLIRAIRQSANPILDAS